MGEQGGNLRVSGQIRSWLVLRDCGAFRGAKWKGLVNTIYREPGAPVGRNEGQFRDPSEGVRPVRVGERKGRRRERAGWW